MLGIYCIDAFTECLFAGNPAGVCILQEPVNVEWMQKVAKEMNLSETVFLTPGADGYRLRWFTPITEVDLCGHATLASAHILWEKGFVNPDKAIRFFTGTGTLMAKKNGDWIQPDFPADPPSLAPPSPGMIEGLGVKPLHVTM